ncbi:MAG: Panacea domain-containing protein [Stellaceae bacterium]
MGLIKLNKILWKADFDAYAARNIPVTGRAYQRLELGPAPREMRPLLNEMIRARLIHLEETDFGDGVIEYRPIADKPPSLDNFGSDDIEFVDASIVYYWNMTGKETSDDSHGIPWRSRKNNEPMFYELSFISDSPISPKQIIRISAVIRDKKRAVVSK